MHTASVKFGFESALSSFRMKLAEECSLEELAQLAMTCSEMADELDGIKDQIRVRCSRMKQDAAMENLKAATANLGRGLPS